MHSKISNIWILGGMGFIGQSVVNILSCTPNSRLNLLIHKNAPLRDLEAHNTFTGSLDNIDPEWLKNYPPDVIFHLARPAGRYAITRELISRYSENANHHLVKQLIGLSKPPIVIYVSGSLMYGERSSDNPAFEDSPLSPVAFGKSYYRNETPWMEARNKGLLDVRFARPGWVIGATSWFKRYYWEHYLKFGKIPCYGDGSQYMSAIHLNDCASMIAGLYNFGHKSQDLNIFSGNPIKQMDFAQIIAMITGADIEKIKPDQIRRMYGDTAAKALLASIPMNTHHIDIHQKIDFSFPDHEKSISQVIGLLKNIQ